MSDSPNDNERRHWHGAAGDRYEHVNAWTAGGAKGPTSRAAWALTPEMMANLNARKVLSTLIPTFPKTISLHVHQKND